MGRNDLAVEIARTERAAVVRAKKTGHDVSPRRDPPLGNSSNPLAELGGQSQPGPGLSSPATRLLAATQVYQIVLDRLSALLIGMWRANRAIPTSSVPDLDVRCCTARFCSDVSPVLDQTAELGCASVPIPDQVRTGTIPQTAAFIGTFEHC